MTSRIFIDCHKRFWWTYRISEEPTALSFRAKLFQYKTINSHSPPQKHQSHMYQCYIQQQRHKDDQILQYAGLETYLRRVNDNTIVTCDNVFSFFNILQVNTTAAVIDENSSVTTCQSISCSSTCSKSNNNWQEYLVRLMDTIHSSWTFATNIGRSLFLDCLTLQDGTDRLSHNIRNQLSSHTMQQPKRGNASTRPQRKQKVL